MAENELRVIREINEAFQSSEAILLPRVRNWMSSQSLAVRANVVDLITAQAGRIAPPLSTHEIFGFLRDYYRECLIRDDQDSDFVPNRHIAGYDFVRWFKTLWCDPTAPREHIESLKSLLRELYVQALVPQDDIVTAVLEHLFESAEIQDFFADWKSDPELSRAFNLAKEWGDSHLTSPNT
jgi:hypothetical protein